MAVLIRVVGKPHITASAIVPGRKIRINWTLGGVLSSFMKLLSVLVWTAAAVSAQLVQGPITVVLDHVDVVRPVGANGGLTTTVTKAGNAFTAILTVWGFPQARAFPAISSVAERRCEV